MTLTAVIPTRNRPKDLTKAVESVFLQTRLPDELLIIDQSPNEDSKILVNELIAKYRFGKTNYIHDINIKGLVHAKQVATQLAKGTIICFLEDDVELEPEYLAQIEVGFEKKPEMLGCSGIITNPFPQPAIYNFIFNIFHRGIFKDERLKLYRKYEGWNHELVPSDKLSGGLSAWRLTIFKEVSFNSHNGFFMLEDIDFSTSVARKYGQRLYINPNARLQHHWSPVNRDLMAVRQQKKIVESINYYKLRKDWQWARLSTAWLLVGLLLEAFYKSLVSQSALPLSHYFMGVSKGLRSS